MNQYKIVLSSNSIYKEIELAPGMQRVKVGTSIDCDFRLHKELFFDSIELIFVANAGEWSVYCQDNLYLTVGDVRKLMTKKLVHGDMLEVRYQGSDNLVFTMDFLIDFEDGTKKYDRIIDLSSTGKITIGSKPSFNICLSSEFIKADAVELTKRSDAWMLTVRQTTYGVYHNGKKSQSGEWIANEDFLSISDYFFYFKDGKLLTQSRKDMAVNGLSYIDKKMKDGYPKFNRNTRIKTVVCDEKLEILDPPEKPQKPKNDLFMRLLPSLGMILASGVMAFFGGMMIVMSVVSGAMAIVTSIIGILEGNREYKKDLAERTEKYEAYIERKKLEIEQCRNQERIELEENYVSQQVEEERFQSFSSELFDRSRDDEDFLCVQLGTGDVLSKRQIEYKKQEKLELGDELQQIPEKICNEFKYVHNAPVVCDFKSVNAVGIVGEQKYRFEMMKNIVIDLVARQYFSDVNMFFVAEQAHKEQIQWMRFLPYVHNEELGIRNIVCDDESKKTLFEYLYKELSRRSEETKARQGQEKKYANLILFFYDEYGFKSHPVSKFVEKAKELGVTFVFFGETPEEIPQGCGSIITIQDEQNATLVNTQNKNEAIAFVYSCMETVTAKEIVNLLAPVYTEKISLESALTTNITMFELLHVFSAEEINLKSRWEKSQVFKSMAAPIGVSTTGVMYLDLHDKAHGPHGLVAGTTGSGKSEILQTYILAMATLFHPYEVAFVIIDFKGGGMVNQFRQLPHLLGAITNIDGKEINRSLKSVKAELEKRQRLFAEAGVNHIDKYIKKYKSGEVRTPLPHLIIIVDEFAELRAEQPDFMAELISAARIGRSLGVHLILATQKPSGQVDDQIWSNSRFKLCLKVQDQADSNEVLKSPVAAEIKEPGRAYLQVGNNEIFQLFQSAYSGAPEKTDDSNVKEFTIFSLTESGKRFPVFAQKRKKSDKGNKTQLDAIVQYVSTYCKDAKIAKLSDICLPSLGKSIEYVPALDTSVESGHYRVEIGVYDDPDNQYQGAYTVDLESSNLFIDGSSQMGKTNMLQTIIRCLADQYTPKEVNIYIIDFASRVLKNFEKLNHVGGVVCPSEDEKLKNLFKLLNTEIETRKQKLVSVGVSSFTAYKEMGETDLPLIVLMIDNLRILKELYFQDDDGELLNLCREGLAVGISIIVADSQAGRFGYRYLASFSTKIVLYCNDQSEYSDMFNVHFEKIDSIPGRCIVEIDKKCYECQSYLSFEGEKEIDRVNKIKEYISEVNAVHKNMFANRIPLIPETLTKGFMLEQFGNYMEKRFSIVSGLDYATVSPFVIDFASIGVMGVSGHEGSGRHNWIQYSIDMLDTMHPGALKLYIVDNIEKRLSSLKESDSVASYSMIAEDAVSVIRDIEQQLKERYDALVSGDENVLENAELLMLVIENQDALSAICNDLDGQAAYQNITGRYKNMKVCMIVFMENAPVTYMSPQILKDIRDQRKFMYFDDVSNMKILDIPLSVNRMFKKPIELGDGYFIRDNEYVKLKTPISVRKGGRK